MSRKALFILHGKQASNDQVRDAVMAQREKGWELVVRVTWEDGDIERFVDEAVSSGFSHIVAGGGDGTLGTVAATVAERAPELAMVLVPLGTANDFAVAAGIPQEPDKALDLLNHPAIAVDLGRINDHYFLNMVTGGFGSNVTANTSEDLKKMLGGAAYLITGISRLSEADSLEGFFKGPDFEWQGRFVAFGVGNGQQAGGGQVLCPRASIDDGLLELSIVPASDGAVATLGAMLSSSLRGVDSVSVNAMLPWCEITVKGGVDINLDGEPHQLSEMRFSIAKDALKLHIPESSPLLKTNQIV